MFETAASVPAGVAPHSPAIDWNAVRRLVADLAEEAGSQRKLGEATGLDTAQVSRFLSGKRQLDVASLQRLAAHAGLDLEDLLAGRRPASRRLLLRLSDIHVHSRQNPRQASGFDPQAIIELADSIAEQGLLQPLVVTEHLYPSKGYSLVAGERRYRALSRLIDRDPEAFLQRFPAGGVPCELRTIGKEGDGGAGKLTAALAENLARADLAPWEITQALATLQERNGRTAKEIAAAVGLSERRAQQHLQIARELPDRYGEAWLQYLEGKLDFAEARNLVQTRRAVLQTRSSAEPAETEDAAAEDDQVDLEELIEEGESEEQPAPATKETPDEERIVVYDDGRGHDAVIRFARIEDAWRSGYSYWTGSQGGTRRPQLPSNLSYPTRDAAIQAAARYLAKAHLDNLESNSSAVSEATRRRCRKALKALADHLAPEDAHLAIPPAAPETRIADPAETADGGEDLDSEDDHTEPDETPAAEETAVDCETTSPVDIELLRAAVAEHRSAGLALALDALLRATDLVAIQPGHTPAYRAAIEQAETVDPELAGRLSPIWDTLGEHLPVRVTRSGRLAALIELEPTLLYELLCQTVAERVGPLDPTGGELLRTLARATGTPLLEGDDDD